ncbi:MAG: DUF2341 domain-containing protein [Minisyncoccia bacterium]
MYKKTSAGLVSIILLLALTSVAESSLSLTRKLDTINVIPSRVESTVWHNKNEALIQDVNESGVYQNFTTSNAAYFDNSVEEVDNESNTPPQVNTEVPVTTPDDVLPEVNSETDEQSQNTMGQSSDADADISAQEEVPEATDASIGEGSTPSQEPVREAPQEEAPAVESQPSSEGDSALETLSKSFFTFTNVARGLHKLVFESVTTPATEESTVEEAVIESAEHATSSMEEDSIHTDEEIVDAEVFATSSQDQVLENEDLASSDQETTVTQIGDDTGIIFSGFEMPKLESGQFIKNTQLRMSLAGLTEIEEGGSLPSIDIEYSFSDEWINAGTILIDGEVSNALNGGYFLFALPKIKNVSELEHFKVRAKFAGDTESLERVYVDALWLQIDTETFDRSILKERLLPEGLDRLKLPTMYEMVSTDLDFTRDELPKFTLKYESQRNVAIRFLRGLFGQKLAEVADIAFTYANSEFAPMAPQIDVTNDGLFTIQLSEEDKKNLRPGEYTINITVNEGGKLFVDTFSFQWGLLAINSNQTEYALGDTTSISLGALSPGGNTLCEANLELYIIDPNEFISQVPVERSGLCNGNNVVDSPDYLAQFLPDAVGTYEMYVESLDVNGEVLAHTSDTFKVIDPQNLMIARNGPTRIFPRATYPMELTVVSAKQFKGILTERVPSNFEIGSTTAQITQVGDEYELTWDLNLDAGVPVTVVYTFDAPDISPYLYTVGPAEITLHDQSVALREDLQTPNKQLLVQASVTEGDLVTLPQEESVVPAEIIEPVIVDEVTVPEVAADVIIEETNIDSVVPTEVPAQTTEPLIDPALTEDVPVIISDPLTASSSQIIEVPIAPVPVATSPFKEHRKWQIASDATGSMIVYWTSAATIPAGWTCISCTSTSTFYNRFAKGDATYGATGGVATSTHTASGLVNASTAANAEGGVSTFVSIVSHSHTITPTIASTTTLPAYRQLRVIQNNSAGDPGTIPAGAVLIFDGTLPSGWVQYAALDGRYPMGQNTIVSSSTNTHRHTVSGTTGGASGTTYQSRTGGTQVTAAAAGHTHTISSSTPLVNHEPPYIEVIFATSSVATTTPVNAIAMWSDTPPAGWLNRSAQIGDPFYGRYIKGAATYGTTGGSDTHTHADMYGIVSSAAIGTDNARTGSSGAQNTHTHAVDVTSFDTASNTPPYVSVVFAKFYGYIPIYDQVMYRWYANQNADTPTDPWPVGGDDVIENEPIDTTLTPVKNGDVIRLRMQLNVSNSTTTSESFKLQFGTTTSVCTAVTAWTDVGALASSTVWIGYNNAGVADGATLSSSTLTGSDVLESYEEVNPTVAIPNSIGIGQSGEWDYVLKQNGAEAATDYCFRMVESDGTELFTYTEYPRLTTNAAPHAPVLTKLFDNEKVGTTTPQFEFSGIDSETNDLTYQIQIDNDYAFGSINVDNNSVTDGDQFENLNTPADKDPYTNGETIRYTLPSALTNGITYHWRVRAQDPNGSNAWGPWSQIYSFTIDTSVTVSTWFQTTEKQFDTDTLAGTDALVTDLVQLLVGSTTGTTTSSQIDFLNGSIGNAWGSFSWTDNESVGDIKHRVEYYDELSTSWALIPDADLSGNSAGFDTSPVSLLTLDVDTYRILRLTSVFTNAGGTPTLSDWTVSWGYRIDTPTNNAPFPNEKVGTTTPTFEFTTTDPQGDSLMYEIQWSTTYAFTASTTRTSASSTGFVNSTNGGDTSPFNSGDTIQFTIQSADVLVNGTTYWWRVRASDPLGSNGYSFYTTPQSITVDTTVTVSTWFQTTQSQFDTDILSGTLSQTANSVTVATTSSESLIAYSEGVTSTPKYRVWSGTAWGTESNALPVGAAPAWTVTKAAPAENEYILGTLGTDADVNVQVYSNGSWGNLQEVTTAIPNTSMRGFDVAYEQTSGDALVVTCDGDADPSYYVWNGSSWTSGGAIGLTGGNTCGWIKLISDPTSDEIIAVTRDTSGITYEARVWSGSAWGNSATWGSMQNTQTNHEGIAAEYEESGGQAVVVVSNGTASSFSWRAWNGATWSASAAVTLGDDFEAGMIAADDGTDTMALCYIDEDRDIGVVRWNGAAWNTFVEQYTLWSNTTDIYNDRPVDCAYEVGGARDGYIMMAYATTTAVAYQSWNGATWSTAARASTLGAGPRVQLKRTGNNLIQLVEYASTTDRYDYTYWNGTSWSALQTLETDGTAGATPFKEPFMIAPKNPVTTGTVVGDPGIDFYAGSGPYWQQMSWVDTETGGSSILYQMEYYNTASSTWDLISDTLIPGNSTGTTTSPINLTNVLPASTYSLIRPIANMTCNAGTCPTLSDWTITWSAGITISGTAQQYNQSSNVTSGTVAVAVNGVLQAGKTGTISGGAWTIANVNTAPGDVVTVFVSGANDANEAVGVARYDGVGNMSGMQLFERHVTLGSDDATTTPFTNADIGLYDYSSDEDLFHNATTTTLSTCVESVCGDAELYIKSGFVYQPTGSLSTHDIENNGTVLAQGNTLTISGSWDNNGTSTMATSTVIFSATSTAETIDGTGSVDNTFYNVTFGNGASTAVWTPVTTLDIDNNLTVSNGTLSRSGISVTVGGNLVNGALGNWSGIGTTTFDGTGTKNWSDSNATLQNVGNVVVDGTSKTIQLSGNVRAQSIQIGADDIFDASTSNYDISLYGDFINGNSFVARSGEVIFISTTTNHIITAGSDAFYDLTFNGVGGAWSFTEADLLVNNDLRVATGTLTMPTGTTTLAGSFSSVGGTFAHNNATLLFTSGSAETIAASGTPFTNAFYRTTFNGGGSWSFLDASATTSDDMLITSGTVTLPSNTLTVGGSFTQSGGSFAHNSGTVKFTSAGAETIDINSTSFNTLFFTGAGSWSFLDANVTTLGNVSVTGGTVTLPSGIFTLGGSLLNTATLVHNNGTILFNSTDTGESISLGNSPLYNATFASATGGWTIGAHATTTNNFTLATSSSFTVSGGQTLSVGGVFSNTVGGASTTWAGSTLSLEAGNYSINGKTNSGDVYGTLRVKANTDIKMWNSSATAYNTDSTGSLYSQDHGAVDGDLYIFGEYVRTSGTEHWSYATDFDGTALGGSSRQVDVRFAAGANASFTGATVEILGTPSATTTVERQIDGLYGITLSNSTLNAEYYDIRHQNLLGLQLLNSTLITSLQNGHFTLDAVGGSLITVSDDTIDSNPTLQIYDVTFDTSLGTSSNLTTGSGNETFLFFDDFNDASIDSGKWTADIQLGTLTESSGYLRAGGGITSGNYGHVSLGSEVGYSSFLNNSVVWRARNSANAIGELVFRGDYGTNLGYKARFDQRAGANGNSFLEAPYSGWTFSNGSGTCTSDSLVPVANQWYTYEVTASSTNFIMYRDGSSMRNCTDTTYALAGEIALQNHYGSYTDYDWVGVRPFVTPAPTSTSWGTEETVRAGLFRESHVVTGSTVGVQVGYVLPIIVNYATGTDAGNSMYCNGLCNTDFSDVRFANQDGSPLSYWRDESYATSSTATFWVKFDSIPASPATTSIYVYYGEVTGINVTQNSGTPTSYWWFRDSVGNIDGEAFDNDTGDPGSVRWDDSSLVITVSGTIYQDDGVTPMSNPTCDGVTSNVKVVVSGGASYTGSCATLDGTYSIGGVAVIGDVMLTTYLDTNGGQQGTIITKTPTANISNHNIYANRIVTRHEDIVPLSIADMATYDFDNDTDIRYLAATGTTDTLTVFAGNELHIASSTTFAPGGNITIYGNASSSSQDGSLHIDDDATFTGSATSTYSIAGSFTMDSGATFTSASTTVVMNATTTGKTITTPSAQEITFNDLTFGGTGGGWNINGAIRAIENIAVTQGTVTGTSDVTVVNGSLSGNGTLSFGSGTTTIERSNTLGGTTAWTFGNLVLGNGTVVGTTTPGGATTTILGKLTIAAAHFLDGNSTVWNLAGTGNVFVENGTFLEDTSTIRYSGVGATNILGTTYYNLDLKAVGGAPTYTATGIGMIVTNDLTVGGLSTTMVNFDTNDTVLDVNGDVQIDATGTLVGSGSALFTVAGSWDNNGIFTGSGGTVTFDNGGTKTIAAGASSFSNVIVNGAGTFTVTEHATTSGTFTLTNATAFTLSSGQVLAVGGTFTNTIGGAATTWTGSTLALYGNGNYSINASTTSDVYETLMVRANTDIRMWNSSAATFTVDATGSLYSQDHGGVNGDLYVYGNYPGNGGTDHWSYATDFDGTSLLGSERNVDVYFENGASAAFTSGGLSVIGIASASTTIQNQGSGTYGLRIGGTASTSWSYYQVRNIDSSGLTFSGTPNVVDLSRGDIEVSQNSATAMTVGGTVITQNPAKTFTNNFFGTSTGISPAFNVTATGTSVSSWRFTNHNGSIDGEAYDVDPNGDPGYVVWDDSAALITVSGTVYINEGTGTSTACDGVTNNIVLRVAGLTGYSTNCSAATGAYSISGVAYSPGDSFIVYIDGEAEKAATVSEDPVSNIGNMDLYENRVIVRHENTDPLSIADMAIWDSSDDADIPFTAVDAGTDSLTLPANRKLLVWTSKSFAPNGNVTISGGGAGASYDGTLELYTNASFTSAGSETHSIGGSLVSGTGATFTAANSTVTFTTTGATRTVDTNGASFYNLAFNGSGSWTVSDSTLTVGNDFSISQGTVTLPSATTTVTGSFAVTGGSWNANGGTMLFNSAGAETIRAGGSSFNALTINGTGSFVMQGTNATATADVLIQDGTFTSATGTLTIGGDFINSDVFNHGSGILRFIAATNTVVTAFGSDLFTTTFASSGPYTFTDTNVALLGSLNIQSGAVNLATGTMSIAGSFLNTGGSFAHGSGTILFNSGDTGETVNPGSSPFYAVTFASAGGGWTISANATTTSNFALTSATNFTLASSTSLSVGGVFTNLVGGGATTWTGSTLIINSGTGYTINTKAAGGDSYNTVRVGSSTALRAWDSSGTITMTDSLSSLYSQDHAGVSGSLYIFGNYARTTGSDYWSYATDFDGTALGGGSRQVYVYMASTSTTTLSGGALNIVGSSSFDTIISNQGGGTYAVDILGGTFNAQYYSFANMDTNGLVLSGTTTVTSLAEGNFTLAVSGGSLITLSSTTLNFNAGLVSAGNSFATTTSITGTNINLVGTTPSAWTFTGHTGNLDGENYDNDGGDACGSIRWSDSSCLLTQQSGYRWRNDDGGEGVPNSEWYDGSWGKRKRVTVTNADAVSYTNAAIKLTVAYDSDMQADFDDLRFTSSNGTTLVNHFIESYTASTDAVVWVEVPTLATSTDTEVYMYYGNGGVSDTSTSTTFNFIDTFEDGNISEYSGDTTLFVTDGTFAKERSYGLDATGNESAKAVDGIYRSDVTVSRGDTLRYFQYINTSAGSGDETCTMFGVQNPGSNNLNYAVCLELFGVDRVSLARDVNWNDASGVIIASTTITYSTGWYEVEVDWNTNNLIEVTVLQNGSVVATTSATDSTYTSGGVGFTFWFQNGGWDLYSGRPLIATLPTTSFGFEQVSGGASWLAALNTPGTGISAGDKTRVRFLVENTGLTVTNQNYEIEFAAKGASPSCEAVNYGDYVEVPNIASCGTSEMCMEASTNFTNLASTTDLLGGVGTFTYGQMVEDGSNNTGNITLDNNEYTELEYIIAPTVYATDSNYCFRVANEGIDLDAYSHVAELGLLFAPNITSLSLNGGIDITLTGGATTTVYATGTVSDLNGYADLIAATSTIFRSGVGESCSLDNNNCYISGNSLCSFVNCAGNSCDVTCSADIYYHADPTDIGTFAGETWRALLAVSDLGGSTATATAPSIDLITLHAISVDSSINYGSLLVGSSTESYNATTTVQNLGNGALDIAIEGTDLTDGGSSVIPVAEQIFATSTFTYASCVFCSTLSSSPANYELSLAKPASTTPAITDEVFWGIEVPIGVAGTAHSGTNIFYAIGD